MLLVPLRFNCKLLLRVRARLVTRAAANSALVNLKLQKLDPPMPSLWTSVQHEPGIRLSKPDCSISFPFKFPSHWCNTSRDLPWQPFQVDENIDYSLLMNMLISVTEFVVLYFASFFNLHKFKFSSCKWLRVWEPSLPTAMVDLNWSQLHLDYQWLSEALLRAAPGSQTWILCRRPWEGQNPNQLNLFSLDSCHLSSSRVWAAYYE